MSTCEIDVTTFPFDKQECELQFGSWTYDGFKLEFDFLGEPTMITDDYFVENKAWKVLETPAKRGIRKYACCPEPYYDLTYTVKFQRSATLYAYILILPCVLLTSLTLVLYWIPPESPTKMSLGMSIFMAFFVLLLLFENNLPPAAHRVPILGTYYCLNMILITMSTFINVFVVNVSFIGSRTPVPRMLKKVMFKIFARILFMSNLVRPFLEADKKRLNMLSIPGMGFGKGDKKFAQNWSERANILLRKNDEIEIDLQIAEIDIKLTDIRDLLLAYSNRTEDKDKKEKITKEWKAVALIFDRLFFTIYLIVIISSFATLMPTILISS